MNIKDLKFFKIKNGADLTKPLNFMCNKRDKENNKITCGWNDWEKYSSRRCFRILTRN